jgi:hypothetical protein
MKKSIPAPADRKQIAIRMLYTVFFLIVLEVIKIVLQVVVVFQYVYTLITCRPSEPMRHFSGKLCDYAFRVMRYTCVVENALPFPFNDFPEPIEPTENTVKF